ncbi:MAG: calcium/sodium antiporter [Rubripirellula sp.]
MDTTLAVVSILVGFVALVGGGEFLVRSSEKLAIAAGISPLVTGLTVVAFATSAPELAVVVQSAFTGTTDLAIGNAVGSNIFNVLFVLGLSAMVAPLVVTARLVRLDVPIMVAATVLLWLLSLDGQLSRLDGLLMVGLLIVYLIWSIRESRKSNKIEESEIEIPSAEAAQTGLWKQVVVFVVGLALLVVGAHFAVDGSVKIAQSFGVSELVIGLTVIAIGTSLPEVMTSVIATLRGQRDIAVGNVIGSNMYNVLGVLGLGSVIAPSGIGVTYDAIHFDMPVMIAVAAACLPIFYIGHRIARWEGGILFAYYIAYTIYLVLHATGSGFANPLKNSLAFFVLPLTVLTAMIGVYRHWVGERDASSPSEPTKT